MICVSVHICIIYFKLLCMSIFELPSNKNACHPSFARDFVDFGRVLRFCSDKRTPTILPNRYKRHPRALPKINCWWVGDIPQVQYLFSAPVRCRNLSPKMARIYEASTKQKTGSKYPTCNLNMDDFQSKSPFQGLLLLVSGGYILQYITSH